MKGPGSVLNCSLLLTNPQITPFGISEIKSGTDLQMSQQHCLQSRDKIVRSAKLKIFSWFHLAISTFKAKVYSHMLLPQ